MKLSDFTRDELVFTGFPAQNRSGLLRSIAQKLAQAGAVADADGLFGKLLEREELMSTAIGQGLAIPHTEMAGVDGLWVVVAQLEKPIGFQSLDGQPVDLVMALVAGPDSTTRHLKVLARISRLSKQAGFLEALKKAQSAGELLARLREYENRMDNVA